MLSDQELDQLIDVALPSYSAAEPRPGLEDRIVNRALAEPRPRRSFVWIWAFTLPAIACLLVFLYVARRHNSDRNTLEATATITPATTAAGPQETPATDSFPSPRKRLVPHKPATQLLAHHEVLPKEEVFPSPSPLTAEEQTLVASNRAQLRTTIARPGTQLEINPLIIAELEIKPLDIPALDQPASNPRESSRNDQQP